MLAALESRRLLAHARCSVPAISLAGGHCTAADTIARIKAAHPSLLVYVDPILGDAGRLRSAGRRPGRSATG
jgi:hypothetical protein